eukprot:38494-Amphidinium_carterae.1
MKVSKNGNSMQLSLHALGCYIAGCSLRSLSVFELGFPQNQASCAFGTKRVDFGVLAVGLPCDRTVPVINSGRIS